MMNVLSRLESSYSDLLGTGEKYVGALSVAESGAAPGSLVLLRESTPVAGLLPRRLATEETVLASEVAIPDFGAFLAVTNRRVLMLRRTVAGTIGDLLAAWPLSRVTVEVARTEAHLLSKEAVLMLGLPDGSVLLAEASGVVRAEARVRDFVEAFAGARMVA
jgi:hypothetical protein